ncbi:MULTISPECIES: ATP-dependent helicase [Pandoraea]|uniref:DNA 3'-5' helicase n=2 Tax=Pandoraea TaxID=93217 RepID=A0A5E4XCI1_9BURK|nr:MULTISPECIES: ATP-dependent helicase [Pandoraea]VVE16249.1 DNA helicase [Pandoraea cepalis]VVE33983.1 DNA helicase [Pandoraea terrigena]
MNDAIARILAPLNDEQMAVANCEGNCLVIAGPGSGKTNTISRKIAATLQNRSERIAAVTFTREAALELRARTIALAGKQAASRILVGTFHSVMNLMSFPDLATDNGREVVFGRDIIAGRPWPFGKTKWKIVKEGMRRSFILRALSELAIEDLTLEEASRIIEQVKSGRPAAELRHEQMTQIYTDIMSRQKVIDFQDILLKTNAGLESGAVPPLNVTRLFIDEYQDTDKPQFDMAAAHHRANVILTGVGDDDQSIYGFRNALGYEGMQMFERSFNAERLMLGNNYRSHAEIVSSATRVINHNLDRVDKNLVAMKGPGGKTAWKTFKTQEEEAHAAARYAADALRFGSDVAIFARNNRRLDEVEARLQSLGIPYRRPPGESILNSVEVMIFCAAIQAVVKPEKKVIDQLLSWCRVDEQSIVKLEKLFRGAFLLGQSEDFARAKIEDSVKEKWRGFVKLFTGWQSSLVIGADTLLIYGISDWLSSYAPDKRSQNVIQIARDMFMPRRADPERGILAQTVQDRLTAIKMAQSKRDEKKPEGADAPKVVELMTAHGSKGLEFDHVWVVGAEDDVFPAKDGTLEEERRLMFVAMTRARKDLMLSTGGGKPPSMFLKESGIERIVDQDNAYANLVDA